MVGVGSDDLSDVDEADPQPKRRRVRCISVSSEDDDEEEEAKQLVAPEIVRIVNRRGHGSSCEYPVQWEDRSSGWKAAAELLEHCSEPMKTCDKYLDKHPKRDVPFASFISSDLPSIQLLANDSALHAVQMVFELMGGLEREVTELGKRKEVFMQRTSTDTGDSGGLKYSQLVAFLRDEVPHTGYRVCKATFKKNRYKGIGHGPLGVAQLTWRTVDLLANGVYLVYRLRSSRRGHCIAVMRDGDSMVVRENSVTLGIMTQTWIRNICFVRQILLLKDAALVS
ncbi:unnamed protein product [Hyaloperonospora brassicae]|uniref:Chromo domain-containing protein n=1 Tax=Hyaloperonospora brassicae TaxID=162125 RepID=A0AAV0TQI5_HYABA|nr:unnamed protein product [Hyaloperonospora brassicae]